MAEWQTRRIQNPLPARVCRFESGLGYPPEILGSPAQRVNRHSSGPEPTCRFAIAAAFLTGAHRRAYRSPVSDTPDRESIDFDDVVRVLGAAGRLELVLVGGQAVAVWAYHYACAGRLPELANEREMFVSKDVDVLTEAALVLERMSALARELDGTASADEPPPHGAQELAVPALRTAVVSFVDSAGVRREIDVLGTLYGVAAEQVLATAAQMTTPTGETAYYQHPVLLVESRLANCADLPKYQTARGIRQAEVSILVLREFLIDLAHEDARAARQEVAGVERMCRSERGLRAFHELGLDPWPAVSSCVPLLGEGFAKEDYPRRAERIVSAHGAWKARRT